MRAPRRHGRRDSLRYRGAIGLLVATLVGLVASVGQSFLAKPAIALAATGPAWQVTWTSPMDLALSPTYDSTVRDVASVAVAGRLLELTFSNLWSPRPTTFAAVTVGVAQTGPTIVAGSFVPVTFNHGQRFVTIPANGRVTSTNHPRMTIAARQSKFRDRQSDVTWTGRLTWLWKVATTQSRSTRAPADRHRLARA